MARQGDDFLNFVLDQLATLRGVRSHAMFGGHGLYCGSCFFGILFRGRLFFKVSPSTRPAFEAQGMKPFRPTRRQTLASFYEVPVDILEEADLLVVWAGQAIGAAQALAVKPTRRTGPRQRSRSGRTR